MLIELFCPDKQPDRTPYHSSRRAGLILTAFAPLTSRDNADHIGRSCDLYHWR